MTKYELPLNWTNYDARKLIQPLTEAKASVMSLVNIPYQRSWVDRLQAIQLKREVAGTSRIEGADFTDRELDLALKASAEELMTRSQRQAHAAMKAYRWIAQLPKDRPINCELIQEVHAIIIGDADADHCPPGVIRRRDQNVTFGAPLHRGCDGGESCERAFKKLGEVIRGEFTAHDPLIQSLMLHFHFAAIHPFLDGNGRTARATEALMLQRAGLTDHLFIAMSNYYYDEKAAYLSALSAVYPPDYDLTPFLEFGLKGIRIQCERLFKEIRVNVSKSIFKNTMHELFGRLQSQRKAVIAKRHIAILNLMIEKEEATVPELLSRIDPFYTALKSRRKAAISDVIHLLNLGAIRYEKTDDAQVGTLSLNLDWPKEITESGFIETVKKYPKTKAYAFLTAAP